ncbi:hypothetical protein BDV26DRAFT_251870 [Aspergillus bertholletiae]|uniref:Uncharacterized protein n=1 Tax=Aspergillus bertholletiae TaxID=1226010 RepID=A0A5N7BN41_9EURO|nr:hypothetical protein BDV26DRAFT_251870 [Aspergillus bertholletiae]
MKITFVFFVFPSWCFVDHSPISINKAWPADVKISIPGASLILVERCAVFCDVRAKPLGQDIKVLESFYAANDNAYSVFFAEIK